MLSGKAARRVIAVIGDGSMTGGMAFEALNNLGQAGKKVLIVLNDNGRSYAPTVSWMTDTLSRLLHLLFFTALSFQSLKVSIYFF